MGHACHVFGVDDIEVDEEPSAAIISASAFKGLPPVRGADSSACVSSILLMRIRGPNTKALYVQINPKQSLLFFLSSLYCSISDECTTLPKVRCSESDPILCEGILEQLQY